MQTTWHWAGQCQPEMELGQQWALLATSPGLVAGSQVGLLAGASGRGESTSQWQMAGGLEHNRAFCTIVDKQDRAVGFRVSKLWGRVPPFHSPL